MRILAVADPHGIDDSFRKIKKKAEYADIILVAGDMTFFGVGLDHILKKMDRWNRPTLIIPGNHEAPKILERSSSKYRNIIYLDERAFEIGNYLFLGSKGSGFAIDDARFSSFSAKFLGLIKEKRKLFGMKGIRYHVILMTHAPPYRTECDRLFDSKHCGNRSIRSFIRSAKPDLAICGHIHECFNTEDYIGDTLVVNPGIYGRIIEI